jgi:hypothetical protein
LGRRAIFVDAGYLLSAGAQLVGAGLRRDQVVCRHATLLEAIVAWADRHGPQFAHLRSYWFDGTLDGRPTVEQNYIASRPYVSVRLGRLSRSGSQKGVDTLMVMDLLSLAYRSTIARVYLLSGDEDLCEAVLEAERLGVHVVLVGVPALDGQHNSSAHLRRAADEAVCLPEGFWAPHFRLRGEEDAPLDELVAAARAQGELFAREFVASAPPEEVEEVLAAFPQLPHAVDARLLAFVESTMGSLRRRSDLKVEARGQFQLLLGQHRRSADGARAIEQIASEQTRTDPGTSSRPRGRSGGSASTKGQQ